ncbi:SusC/RagA family TonB-linked outer membrane protein [Bacteroides muris (ex Fokt et al. 2023)]|uniref:SusC/RagA family TonB-linked outer membrane protein n=1 Tax=Bacteroides muris (ex Fokt et al. 2023) TaxID=2937417 RepID=A0A9X2SQN7_9BACE|nr:SusC/RagA family TonB-linked outer membrane protein [Bacteroides muris (ex Fokt et al. 2023)]MCR6503504.1 SusC/RagA family TonB-linked outer membrane protein [Bacteroides muris (ex Fokt et al. 2023)]
MKVKKCKNTLLCGTLTLCLWGGFSQVRAASFENFAIEQQSNKVIGTVKDEFGPVIGASVVEKGTSNGVVTDLNGKFSLNVKPGATLIISFVGYKQQEVKAGNAPLNIVLEEDSKMLGEVVVTALGIKRERKALGYGVAEVQGEALTKAKETNVINSMAGRVPGLVVSQTAGGASGSSRVILRGSTEMTGNNQPLYVIDGVPLDNTNFGSAGTYGGFDLGDGISSVNPDDIESMSVLKGPAASALYGSRASHGVILITTKKANKDKISVEYNGTMTFDTQLAKWDDVQQIYGMGSNGTYPINAVSNTNMSWGAKADGTNMLKYFDGVERPYLIVPDNTSQFFRTGFTATNSAIIGVNNGKTGIRFTYTDMRNKDIVPKTHMSRDIFNLRANTTAGKFDLDFSGNYTREDVKNRPALGDSKSNIGKNLMTLATTYDQKWLKTYQDANGEYSNWNGMDPYNVNPYWDVYKNSNNSKKDQFRFNGKVVWNITQHLKIQGTAGAELNWFTFEDYKAPTTPGYESGYLQNNNFRNRMYNFELLALYNNSWGDFDFNATLGGNLYKVNNQTIVTTAKDMKIRDVVALMSFNEVSVEPYSYRKQINSIYGAVNLGWKHMLYFDATLRGDQSSTLPVSNNMYIYPSFSGSFVFSELLKLGDKLPYGKVRMSWAQVGSDTDPYQLGLVYTKSKFAYPGYTIGYISNGTIPNKDLKPTKTNSFEMGLELKFLKNRIGLDFTYYSQLSKNQIMGMASSSTSGYGYRLINAGEIENKGVEIALNTRPIQTKDFSWDLNFNFSKNSNKVKKLVDDMDMFELEKATWLDVQVAAKVGENFGSIVGPDFQRNENGDILIDPSTGLPMYDKSNHVLGNASWDWTGGVHTNFSYKNISLSAVFDVKVGADLYSMSARAAHETGKSMVTLEGREAWYKSEEARQAAGYAKDSPDWMPTGGFIAPGVIDNGDGTYRENDIVINPEKYWMSVCRNAPSMFIYDNSYVKCREITLSYTLPKAWLKNVVDGLTISFVARNPFIVWKNIPNIDPDSNYNNTTGMGMEYGSLPSRKSYGFNVNVKF